MATHSSILVWRIPKTEEPGELQSKCSQRVGQDLVTNTFTFYIHSSRREDSTHIGHMDVVVRGTVKHHQGLCEAGFAVSRGQGAPQFPQEDAIGLFSLIIPQAVRKLKLIKNKQKLCLVP